MYLLMTEIGHLGLSIIAGYVSFKRSRRLLSYFLAILSGFLVDLDHVIDYFLHKGLKFDLRSFISGQHYHDTNTSYILFHSWELILVLGVLLIFNKKKDLLFPIFLGLLFHLIWDYLTNPIHWYTYFLIGRYLQGFALNRLFVF